MKFEYRQVINGFELTKEENEILYKAEQILCEMEDELDNSQNIEIEKSLREAVEDALNFIQICNCKLSIHTKLGVD